MTRRQLRGLLAAVAEPWHATLVRAVFVYFAPTVWAAWWLIMRAPGWPIRNTSALLLLAGLIAAFGGLTERWSLERVGVIGLAAGWTVHLLATLTTPSMNDRWDEVAIVGLIGALVARALWITWIQAPENPWRARRGDRVTPLVGPRT